MTNAGLPPDGPAFDMGAIRHIGLVVDDLEGAMAELNALAGCQWGPTRTSSRRLRTPGGVIQPTIRYAVAPGEA